MTELHDSGHTLRSKLRLHFPLSPRAGAFTSPAVSPLARPRSIPRRPASSRGRVGARGSQPRTPRHRTISRLSRATCRDRSGRSGRPRGGPGGCVRDRLDVANGVVERLTCRRVRRSEVIGSLGRARHGVIGGVSSVANLGSMGSRYEPRRWLYRIDGSRNLELDGLICTFRRAFAIFGSGHADAIFLSDTECHAERGSRSNGDSVADGPRTRPACDPRNPTRRSDSRPSAASSSTSNPFGRLPTSAWAGPVLPQLHSSIVASRTGASSLHRTTTGHLRCSTRWASVNGSVATFALVKARLMSSDISVIPLLWSVALNAETCVAIGSSYGHRSQLLAQTSSGRPGARTIRTEWVAGAEEEWRKRTGRPMTAEELEAVIRRYRVTSKGSRPESSRPPRVARPGILEARRASDREMIRRAGGVSL